MNKNMKKIMIALLVVLAVVFAGIKLWKDNSEGGMKVTVTIQCDQLLGEGAAIVDENTKQYIPEDGYVLKEVEVSLTEGANAFDALKKACEDKDIALDYEDGSYGAYVKGINYLYEVVTDNSYAGWMYMVNGEEPTVGASEYILEEGADVLWYFSSMEY